MPLERMIQPPSARILIADDQPHILAALRMLLHAKGYQTFSSASPTGVLSALQQQAFDAIVIDLNYTRDTTGGAEGLELVRGIRLVDPNIPILVMTAWGSVDLAVEAMQLGASDFVQKPWSNDRLLEKVREQVERGQALRFAKRAQEQEEADARAIQQGLLPRTLPAVPGYDVAGITQSARFVGGDYFDVVPIDKNRIAFCVADAAGKGLPAALLISNLQAALRPLILKGLPPAEVCSQLNRTLSGFMPDNKFITLFYAVLDAGEGRFTYCNAGHNPPILVRSNGHAYQLEHSGAVLGQLPQWSYEQIDLELRGGDTLLLFTDGLVEVCDEKGNLFGEERLLHLMQELSTSDASANSASALQNSLLANVSAFCQGSFQDDATMLIVRPDRL